MAEIKNKPISLSDYRKKKQKLQSKNKRKAASDETTFFVEDENTSDDFTENKPAQIYYMKNYIKTKNKKPKEIVYNEENPFSHTPKQQNKSGKILFFSNYQRKKQAPPNQLKQEEKEHQHSELISLEAYRNKKQKEQRNVSFIKQTVSYGAVALAMLMALNVFLPTQNEQSRGIASPDKPHYIDEKSQNTKEDKSLLQRGISSLLTPSDMDKDTDNTNWNQQLKNIDLSKQKNIVGKKPNSSEYKGF